MMTTNLQKKFRVSVRARNAQNEFTNAVRFAAISRAIT